MDIKAALNKIAARQDLTGEEMRGVMTTIMNGEATPSQIGAFLMGLRVKGESVGEIAAAVSILREKMVAVEAPEDAIDIVGVFPNYAAAEEAWRSHAQRTVDDAEMKYVIVHLHRLLEPDLT